MDGSDSPDPALRRRLLRRLRIYFAHQRWPRTAIGIVLLLTAAGGFFTSFLLLRIGLGQMWIRYPLAATVAWLLFIGLVRVWAAFEHLCFGGESALQELERRCDPGDRDALPEFSADVARDWVNLATDFPHDDEGCLLWLLVIVLGPFLLATAVGIYGILASAPALIAELFLDAILVSALYRRLRVLDRRWWVTSVVRRTCRPLLWTVITLSVIGGLLQAVAPEAESIGGVIEYCREAGKP
jgi:hypothetical protein